MKQHDPNFGVVRQGLSFWQCFADMFVLPCMIETREVESTEQRMLKYHNRIRSYFEKAIGKYETQHQSNNG